MAMRQSTRTWSQYDVISLPLAKLLIVSVGGLSVIVCSALMWLNEILGPLDQLLIRNV